MENLSYWESKQFFSDYDCIIIGGGLVGLTTALNLKQHSPALKVGVLEAGHLPSGASTKNAGFACFGSISELIEFQEETSEARIVEYVRDRWEGLCALRKNIGDDNLCFQQAGGYEVFRSFERESAQRCCDRVGYYNQLLRSVFGHKDAYRVATDKISVFGFRDVQWLIESSFEGSIDSGRMMAALMAKTAALGVQIFSNTRAQNWERSGDIFCLRTSQGTFSSKTLVLATNAFARELLPQLDVVPGRGQVLVTAPIDGLKLKGTFHYSRGYYYFREIDGRILLGGGRNLDFAAERTTQFGLTKLVQDSLEELLREVIVPERQVQIAQRWSGIMAFGDGIESIVEQVSPGLICAVRCQSMGVALGSSNAKRAADLVLQCI